MNYLSIDVGTTRCKCQLFDERGDILEYKACDYGFMRRNGKAYVDIAAIRDNVFRLIQEVASSHGVDGICVSSFGEAFVLSDKDDNILFPPMLYTDNRGEAQAKQVSERLGDEYVFATTGTIPHGMYSLYKLLYIKENYPEVYAKADKLMLIGDYMGYLLTGKRVIDYALAARTGALDIQKLEFCEPMLSALGIDKKLFSEPQRAGYIVGEINNAELGLKGCKLVLGSHDQVCTALGAGVIKSGQAVDGMGTVECITVASDKKCSDVDMGRSGFAVVPYPVDGMYCTYIVNYACCSILNWFTKDIAHGYCGDKNSVYDYYDGEDDGGLFVLPYFGGNAVPYNDINAKGSVIGLTAQTTDKQIYRAITQSLAYEMKFECEVAKQFGMEIKQATATGGGANSDGWLQLKADIQNVPYETLRSAEGGLCGCAVLCEVALGGKTFEQATDAFVVKNKKFTPDKNSGDAHKAKYEKYKELYNAVKEFN